jgi:hypothetical protein
MIEKNDMIEKNELSQMGGAYLMSQKLKICKLIRFKKVRYLKGRSLFDVSNFLAKISFVNTDPGACKHGRD